MMIPDTPGWYPDPAGHARQRYWSEAGWTDHVVDRLGVPHIDPVGGQDPRLRRGRISLQFTAGEKRRNLHLIISGSCLLLAGLFAVTTDNGGLVAMNVMAAGFQASAAAVMPQFGVVLTRSGITLRGFKTRHFPWSDVRSIEPVNFLIARQAQVRFANGSKVRAWAPYDDYMLVDLKFDQKVEAMQQWFAEHAGPEASPNGGAAPSWRPRGNHMPPLPTRYNDPV